MAKLILYGVLSVSDNTLSGTIVKACCEFCGKKFGSIEEARKCESKHLNDALYHLATKK